MILRDKPAAVQWYVLGNLLLVLLSVVSLLSASRLGSLATFPGSTVLISAAGISALRAERIRLTRTVDVVSRHAALLKQELLSPVDLDEIRLRLMEKLRHLDSTPAVVVQAQAMSTLATELRDIPVTEVAGTAQIDIDGLRLVIQLRVAHAAALMEFLSELRAQPGWRPVDVRACALEKTADEPHALQVRCTIDYYHWSLA